MLPGLIKGDAGRDRVVSTLRNTKAATTGVTPKLWDDMLPRFHSPLSLNSSQPTTSYSCSHPGWGEVTYSQGLWNFSDHRSDGRNSLNSGAWEVGLLWAIISPTAVSVFLTNPCIAWTCSYNTSHYLDVSVGTLCLLTLIAEWNPNKKWHSCLSVQQAAHTSASTQRWHGLRVSADLPNP